ncbi:3-deoxy-manno-octulosonate cytidylyltransferase [Terriglobus sp.]|uniref:3-deoxy-manno-octulosonate cytidylyltransferase n=1 Tax=Terriglobus sp. TaxID=1889013 RepID=UPI003AFFCB20
MPESTTSDFRSLGRVVAVIPARLASTRLPRKVLRPLLGKPLLQWVVEAAQRCPQFSEVVIAVDSDEVAALCERERWPYQRTDTALPSGTDRMHAIAQNVDADIYVNVQGDEPLLAPVHIDALLRPFLLGAHVEVATVKTPCSPENVHNPNAVKVVTANDGRALYFSRAAIPYDRDGAQPAYWKHLGLYAYRREALLRFAQLRPGTLEQAERLEQLRLLENGVSLYVEPVPFDTVGVDTEEDLLRVEALLRERGSATSLP